jgi:GntP family gluconate:H+ symporter
MPFLVLAIAILFIIVCIGVFKVHPFLALILAAILTGILSPVHLDSAQPGVPNAVLALELTAREFGTTAGAVGVVIVLAAIIGQCLLESGAADKITRVFLSILGEKKASGAFFASGYFLSIPVFFDTVFFLLIPLVRSLFNKTRKNYVLYVMAICAGAVVTHGLVPPTPGPLIVVETLKGLDLGLAIGLGFLLGLIPAVAGLGYAVFINTRMPDVQPSVETNPDAMGSQEVDEASLPGFWMSALPVVLPVALITGKTFLGLVDEYAPGSVPGFAHSLAEFVGNKNFALLAATFVAAGVLRKWRRLSLGALKDRLEPAIMMGGMIVLITSAGGALGKILSRVGISEAIQNASADMFVSSAAFYVLLAWTLAALMKTAQGSATVAMITASGIMAALIGNADLPCHLIYIYAAIGFGGMVFSWMNDSGFWVVCKMSGFTERQTLSTWTLLLFTIGFVGLLEVLLLSQLFPMV